MSAFSRLNFLLLLALTSVDVGALNRPDSGSNFLLIHSYGIYFCLYYGCDAYMEVGPAHGFEVEAEFEAVGTLSFTF